jgi:hypothetical protein
MSFETEELEQTSIPPSLEDNKAWRRHMAADHLCEMGVVRTAAERADEFSDTRDKYIYASLDQMESIGQ